MHKYDHTSFPDEESRNLYKQLLIWEHEKNIRHINDDDFF